MESPFSKTLDSIVEELLNNKNFGDTIVVCSDGEVVHNKMCLGLLFPCLLTSDIFSLPIQNMILLPHFTLQEIQRKFENCVAALHGTSFKTEKSDEIDLENTFFTEIIQATKRSLDKSEQFRCDKCNYTTKEKSKLKIHVKSAHQNEDFVIKDILMQKENDKFQEMINAKYKKMIQKENDKCQETSGKGKSHTCDICSKVYVHKSHLNAHISSAHSGVRFPCSQCKYKATSKGALTSHVRGIHEGIRVSCEQCEYKAWTESSLRKHVQSVHEGIRYPCTKCDYKATNVTRLKMHTNSVHEGIQHFCDQCDHIAKEKGDLIRHIRTIHEGVYSYPCDQCCYKANRTNNLKRHMKSFHGDTN